MGGAFFHASTQEYTLLFFNWIYTGIQVFSQSAVSNVNSILKNSAFKSLVLAPRLGVLESPYKGF